MDWRATLLVVMFSTVAGITANIQIVVAEAAELPITSLLQTQAAGVM